MATGKPHYITFVGPINPQSTMKLRGICCDLVDKEQAREITILMSSRGGALLEGFALYHFLRALPVNLSTHNIGTIQSVANIVFLAGEERFACEDTYFMLHGFDRTYRNDRIAHRDLLEDTSLLDREKKSFAEILKRRSRITDKTLDNLKPFEKQIIISTTRARRLGLIQHVEQASIPEGAGLWNVEYKP